MMLQFEVISGMLCAKDWLDDEENVVVIGIAAGDVQVLYWEDME